MESNKIETLQDYIEFTRSTAVYPKDRELEYLMFGMVDETMEFKEKVQGSTSLEDVVAEFGDVCWYTARMLDHLEVSETEVNKINIEYANVEGSTDTFSMLLQDVDVYLGRMCGNIKKYIRDDNPEKLKELESNTLIVANRLQHMAPHIGAYNLKNALKLNVDKLSDRQERGVLKGDGDKR